MLNLRSPPKLCHIPLEVVVVGLVQHTEAAIHMHLLKAILPEVRPELTEALADGIDEVAFGVEMTDEDVVFSRPASGKVRARHNENTCMTCALNLELVEGLYSDLVSPDAKGEW
jgi:hypothetical protein